MPCKSVNTGDNFFHNSDDVVSIVIVADNSEEFGFISLETFTLGCFCEFNKDDNSFFAFFALATMLSKLSDKSSVYLSYNSNDLSSISMLIPLSSVTVYSISIVSFNDAAFNCNKAKSPCIFLKPTVELSILDICFSVCSINSRVDLIWTDNLSNSAWASFSSNNSNFAPLSLSNWLIISSISLILFLVSNKFLLSNENKEIPCWPKVSMSCETASLVLLT